LSLFACAAGQSDARNWLEEQKAITNSKIAEWKAKRDTAKLQDHADKAEQYANATIDLAKAALDEAERAALEAWLARQDANFAKVR
jgi:hypothetical protein